MKFISALDIMPGDVIAWAYDGFSGDRSIPEIKPFPSSLVYYEVTEIYRDHMGTIVYGKGFSKDGERHRNYDFVPGDREILLIKRI